MKPTEKIAKFAPFVAGIVAVAAAVLLVVLILLAEIGAIVPRLIPLGLESRDRTKTYDGTPLQGSLVITSGALAEGHRIKILSQTTITTVGEAQSEIDFIIVDETGADVTNRYNVSLQTGTLTVKPTPITVQTGSASKAYDGKPLTQPTFTRTAGSLAPGHVLVVAGSTELTGAGIVPNEMSLRVVDEQGKDVSFLYEIDVVPGRLTVTGRPLTIKTGGSNTIYNGTAVSCHEYEVTSGELLAGHRVVADSYTSFEGVGSVNNVIRCRILDASGNDMTNIYNLKYAYGMLTVTPRHISIEMGSISKIYNGQPVYNDTYTIVSGELVGGHVLSVTGNRRTEVGVTPNDMVSYTIIATLPNGQKVDVSSCYKVAYSAGTITVRVR